METGEDGEVGVEIDDVGGIRGKVLLLTLLWLLPVPASRLSTDAWVA